MIKKEILKRIIIEQNSFDEKGIIKRSELKELETKSKSPFIVIITGIRRCGKSTLLNLFRKNQKEKNYYLNFDDERLYNFTLEDFETLYETFIELFGIEKTFYFDEIQNIEGWERFVRRISDSGNKVYLTGSNASMLSKELGTHLTGRYVQIELFPINFKDYLKFKNLKLNKNDIYKREIYVNIKKEFNNYLNDGGFLQYLKTKDKDFFKLLYDNILYRDIIVRYNLSYEKGLKKIIHYLISNISKEFSYSSLKKISNISSITTISEYLNYLENSYLLFEIPKFDYSLKKQLVNPKKIYAIDTGLINTISFKFSEDKGRLLENLVFIELKRRGKEIFYHKNKKECDFVIREGLDITDAIQITKSLNEDITGETKKREFLGLIDALKTYNLKEGLILTEDEEFEIIVNDKGKEIGDERLETGDGRFVIKVKPIWKWLLE
jgi:hypothetical protein